MRAFVVVAVRAAPFQPLLSGTFKETLQDNLLNEPKPLSQHA